MQNNKFYTIGTSKCPYTLKQVGANDANQNVTTILCDKPKNMQTDEEKAICQRIESGSLKVEGVPANFTCDSSSKGLNGCKMTSGYNPDFGKVKIDK